MSITKEIVICDECKGSGKIQKDELVDYHRGESEYWDEICTSCNGTGRLYQTTEITTRKLIGKDLIIRDRH